MTRIAFAALRALAVVGAVLAATAGASARAQPASEENIPALAIELFGFSDAQRLRAIERMAARGKTDVVAALIEAMPFHPDAADQMAAALRRLTGADIGTAWFDWMLWQEAHPEIKPFAGYAAFKGQYLSLIDPEFARFVNPRQPHTIRLEEISWGGVVVDGIPALDNPEFTAAKDADWLGDNELVFGVAINGDARAYPHRIMDWHEMANDVVGGVPVALAYCTLCGAGILFETRVPGRAEPLRFGSSGLLYRSNKLMYDRQTDSLWNQFTGMPVVGPLVGSGIVLGIRPLVVTRWGQWRAQHPETKVLSLRTGHRRDYSPGKPYGDYFAKPGLMFPARVDDGRLAAKDIVFVLRVDGAVRAWPVKAFAGGKSIDARLGNIDIVLIGDALTETVRAYRRDGLSFHFDAVGKRLTATGQVWTIEESALHGPGGRKLERLPGHNAFWFAVQNYYPGMDVLAPP